jgi:hypothetical protein
MKNLFAISFIYFLINSVYCQSLERIIAKNKKSKGNKPYTIRGYRPYHNTQKVIKGFNVFKLGELQKQDLYKIKSDCDTIYEGFLYNEESYTTKNIDGIVVSKNTYPEYFLDYMKYSLNIQTSWWNKDGYADINDLIVIIDDFDVYYIKNYKFNDNLIDIILLYYQNVLVGIQVLDESGSFKTGFELKNNIYDLNESRYAVNKYDYNIKYSSNNSVSFYDKKYYGDNYSFDNIYNNGLISKRMTKINKQNFINNNKKLKDY